MGTLYCSKLWDTQSGNELYTFSHQHIVKSVDFSEVSLLLLLCTISTTYVRAHVHGVGYTRVFVGHRLATKVFIG